VRPNARHMAQRQHVATTQTWAAQGEWSRMSQGRRILRWLTSRQTRPVTMHAISAAFAQAL
jgi:hypothetical protein